MQQARAQLQAGRVGDALRLTERHLEAEPDSIDGLYLLAVCRRYLADDLAARAALARLIELAPEYGRAHQELGHLERAGGNQAAALAAFRQAVQRNPALTASWRALADLEQAAGSGAAAERARAEFARLAALPAELVSVTSFLHEDRLYKAERLCRAFLKTHPHHLEAMRLLAAIGMRLHVLDDAEFLLESALAFEPQFLAARIDYVEVLTRRQKYDLALAEARKVRDTNPQNPAFQALHAEACMAAGGHAEALEIYARLLGEHAEEPGLNLAYGHALKTVGRQAEAIAAYRGAYRARSDFGDAYWSLANLKTYRFGDTELAAMRAAEAAPGTARVDRYHLCFALGKALEDRAAHAEAFSWFSRGNALKHEELRYDRRRLEAEFDRQKAVCDAALMESRSGAGRTEADPIFIVGLPRAGSTLIEQILASHSQVDGTFELPNVLALVHRLRGRRGGAEQYPQVLAGLADQELAELGRRYLDDTRMHRGGAPFFTDKMPNNFRHLGLIQLMLPNARIIDARRHPMACCVSGFKQLFAEGQEFSYSLDDIGRYYRCYVELMDHWHGVMPGRILEVRHEALVADLEGQVRRLLDFVGLPFEAACLEFHRTERAVRTASSEQVRRPIFDSALEQWRNYEPWLAPLREALGPELAGV